MMEENTQMNDHAFTVRTETIQDLTLLANETPESSGRNIEECSMMTGPALAETTTR
jgi:hypothetical protein